VRSAAARVIALVPTLDRATLSEDDINTLMREMLSAQLTFLKWSVSDQSLRGWSAKGNSGRPDLFISQDASVLAILEAVVCGLPIPTTDLRKHFQKLLGYGDSNVFFHLTYARVTDMAQVFASLKTIATNDAPAEFRFLSLEDLPNTDGRPKDFIARYAVDSAQIAVVFVVLDISQARPKAAAALAGSKRRRKKAPAPLPRA
jgi:hypothetical protein